MQNNAILVKKTTSGKVFKITNISVMVILLIVTLYPFWYCLILSLNDPVDIDKGPLYLLPRVFSTDNYKFVFKNPYLAIGFFNSIARTIVGTMLHLIFTGIAAFGLSKKHLVGRKIYTTIFVITMYFNGGLIPSYLLIRGIGLLDNFLVYVIPGMWSFFNAILFMAFYDSIPDSLEESAMIDGASIYKIFFKIIVPVSLPIFATIALFVCVSQWNAWFDTMIYIKSDRLITLQYIMAKLIQEVDAITEMRKMISLASGDMPKVTTTTVRVATLVVTTFPIVVIYPFFQKYFVKGMMLGAVKG